MMSEDFKGFLRANRLDPTKLSVQELDRWYKEYQKFYHLVEDVGNFIRSMYMALPRQGVSAIPPTATAMVDPVQFARKRPANTKPIGNDEIIDLYATLDNLTFKPNDTKNTSRDRT